MLTAVAILCIFLIEKSSTVALHTQFFKKNSGLELQHCINQSDFKNSAIAQ